MYTWGCKTLHDDYDDVKDGSTCSNLRIPSLHHNGSLHKIGSSKKRRQKNNLDPISFNKKVNLPSEKARLDESLYNVVHLLASSKASLECDFSSSLLLFKCG